MEELISVLIPVYNSEKYLSETLYSLSNQEYKNLEIIIINDGSVDNSQSIIDSYKEKDDRIISFYQENRGIGYTRNRLLKLSRGNLILFVDSDDILSPSFITNLYREKKEYFAQIAAARVVPFKRKIKRKRKGRERIYSGEEFAIEMVRPMGKFCYSHSRLIEKRLFQDLAFPEDKIFEDVFVMPSLSLKAERVVFVPISQYNYRINKNGLSHGSFSLISMDEMDGYLENVELGKKKGSYKIVLYSGLFFLTKYYYYFLRVLFKRLGLREYLKRYRRKKREVVLSLLRR